MIFWTGSGLLVILFLIVGMFVPALLGIVLAGSAIQVEQKHMFAAGVGIAGILCWIAGRKLYGKGERVFVDKSTGREFAVKPSHTFMFIPLHYCGVLLLGAAAYVAVNGVPETRKERRARELSETYEEQVAQIVRAAQDNATPATVADSQSEAMKKYPDLAKSGSAFNREFLALHKKYQVENSAVLKDNRWPILLADEVAAKQQR